MITIKQINSWVRNLRNKTKFLTLSGRSAALSRIWLENRLSWVGRYVGEIFGDGVESITQEVEDPKDFIYGTGIAFNKETITTDFNSKPYTYEHDVKDWDFRVTEWTGIDLGKFFGFVGIYDEEVVKKKDEDIAGILTATSSPLGWKYTIMSDGSPKGVHAMCQTIELNTYKLGGSRPEESAPKYDPDTTVKGATFKVVDLSSPLSL